jgi:hypothetical protein
MALQALPQQSQIVNALQSAQIFFPISLIIIGGLLMAFGYKAYKWIVLLNFVALGWWLGTLPVRSEIAQNGTDDVAIVASAAGAILMGIVAWPMLRYSVAVCGGMVGFALGMLVWAYCDQPLNMAWAGGLVGLVVLGMLSFVLFKTTVILFTSIEGASLFVFGVCALLMRYAPWQKQVSNSLSRPILIPLVITTIAAISLFWQTTKHGLIGHEGAPPHPAVGGKGGGGGGGGDAKKK